MCQWRGKYFVAAIFLAKFFLLQFIFRSAMLSMSTLDPFCIASAGTLLIELTHCLDRPTKEERRCERPLARRRQRQ